MGPAILRRNSNTVKDKRQYYVYLVFSWVYALMWLVAVYVIFFVWKPGGYLRFALLVAGMVAAPHPKDLFQSYSKFLRESEVDLASTDNVHDQDRTKSI